MGNRSINKHRRPARRSLARLAAGLLAVAGFILAGSAFAQQGEMRTTDVDTNNILEDAFDFISNNLYLRLGGAYLGYYGSSSDLRVENAKGLAAQAFGPGTSDLPNTGSGVSSETFPAGTIGLYVPWTGHHLATEVTIAAPIKVDFQVTGRARNESLAPRAAQGNGVNNAIATGVPAVGQDIGVLKTLPPNISFVYRPFVHTRLQPFIGVGAMYLYTYDTNINNKLLNSVNEPTLYLEKPVACTGKLGMDIGLSKKFFFTLQAEYIGCVTVKAKVNDIKIRAPNLSDEFGPIDVGTISSENHFKAVLYQASFGYRF